MRPEPFKTWTRPFRLARHLRPHLTAIDGKRDPLRIEFGTAPWIDVDFVRDERGITLVTAPRSEYEDDRCFFYYRMALKVMVRVFSGTRSIGRIGAHVGDGRENVSDRMLFCGNAPDAVLVPDPEFYNSQAYQRARDASSLQRPWRERSETIVWRGATTGALDVSLGDGADAVQRVRFCRALASRDDTDAKIYGVTEPLVPEKHTSELQSADLIGERVPESAWSGHKFAFDIDGNTNAWSNLFVRLLFGCCVIKVTSPRGFRQWYYDRLEPNVHYVPVKADLSDLHAQIDWCRANPDACEAIAAEGQHLATSMTVKSEMTRASTRLDQRLRQ